MDNFSFFKKAKCKPFIKFRMGQKKRFSIQPLPRNLPPFLREKEKRKKQNLLLHYIWSFQAPEMYIIVYEAIEFIF